MQEWFGGDGESQPVGILVESEGEQVFLRVDEILGKRQVVLKNLEGLLENFSIFSGGALLGDGRVGLVLDIPALLKTPVFSRLEGVAS